MSADNELLIVRKPNGKYEVRHASASSLPHALAGVEPTLDDLTLSIIAEDVEDLGKAIDIANKAEQDIIDEGGEVEYGVRIYNGKSIK